MNIADVSNIGMEAGRFSELTRALACMFWFDVYLRAPDFLVSEGIFTRDPALRVELIQHQQECDAHWAHRATLLGVPHANSRAHASQSGPVGSATTISCLGFLALHPQSASTNGATEYPHASIQITRH